MKYARVQTMHHERFACGLIGTNRRTGRHQCLWRRADAEDREALTVPRDRRRHLPGLLLNHQDPGALGLRTVEDDFAITAVDPLDERRPAFVFSADGFGLEIDLEEVRKILAFCCTGPAC